MGQTVTDVGQETANKKELKKHAATIHCSNTLSLLQRKITNALLYHAYHELTVKNEHEITVKQLCRLIGYQGNNHAAIKGALRSLISTIIEWNLIDEVSGAENWTASSIIASVSLEGPLCYYAYSPRMKQLLHTPSMFGKIDLVIQSKFRSSYGLALYENCIRYRGLPYTKWFEMDLFKKLMGVLPGKYDIFRDLKRRVLDKSIDEVNTYSDLLIIPELIREGRKVVKIRFKLKERAKKERLGQTKSLPTSDTELKVTLAHTFQLSAEQIEQLLTEYGITFIQDKVTLIMASKVFQNGKIQNLAAYLLSAVKRNYQATPVIQNAPVDLQEAKFSLELVQIKEQVQKAREEYKAYREKTIYTAINTLSHEDREKLLQRFYQDAEQSIQTVLTLQYSKYTRETILQSPQIQALLRQFALRELDLLNICSFEEFIAQQDDPIKVAWQKLKSYDPEHSLLRFNE